METSGRERRHRYFTVANYCKLIALESLDKSASGYEDVNLSNVGGFLPLGEELFYEEEEESIHFANTFKAGDKTRVVKSKKPRTNPILPDGKVKRGRPKKKKDDDAEAAQQPVQKAKKRKTSSPAKVEDALVTRRAKKARVEKSATEADDMQVVSSTSAADPENPNSSMKPKRGRRRKVVQNSPFMTPLDPTEALQHDNDDSVSMARSTSPDAQKSLQYDETIHQSTEPVAGPTATQSVRSEEALRDDTVSLAP